MLAAVRSDSPYVGAQEEKGFTVLGFLVTCLGILNEVETGD
jgi:hypothetical protein